MLGAPQNRNGHLAELRGRGQYLEDYCEQSLCNVIGCGLGSPVSKKAGHGEETVTTSATTTFFNGRLLFPTHHTHSGTISGVYFAEGRETHGATLCSLIPYLTRTRRIIGKWRTSGLFPVMPRSQYITPQGA